MFARYRTGPDGRDRSLCGSRMIVPKLLLCCSARGTCCLPRSCSQRC